MSTSLISAASKSDLLAGHIVAIFFLIHFLRSPVITPGIASLEISGPIPKVKGSRVERDRMGTSTRRFSDLLILSSPPPRRSGHGDASECWAWSARRCGASRAAPSTRSLTLDRCWCPGLFVVGCGQGGGVHAGAPESGAALAISSLEGAGADPALDGKTERMSASGIPRLAAVDLAWGPRGTLLAVPMWPLSSPLPIT